MQKLMPLFLLGCVNYTEWDMNEPVELQVDTVLSSFITPMSDVIDARLHQFQGRLGQSTTQKIYIVHPEIECDCGGQSAKALACGNAITAEIRLCTSWFSFPQETSEMLSLSITHELGHILGYRGHSTQPEDVMYSPLNLKIKPAVFSEEDIHKICNTGRVISPACN